MNQQEIIVGAKIPASDRIKFAVYLRPHALSYLSRFEGKSMSGAIAGTVSLYRRIGLIKPGAIAQAQRLADSFELNSEGSAIKKVQTYLSPEDADCLVEVAESFKGNTSLALNQIIVLCAALEVIVPDLVKAAQGLKC